MGRALLVMLERGSRTTQTLFDVQLDTDSLDRHDPKAQFQTEDNTVRSTSMQRRPFVPRTLRTRLAVRLPPGTDAEQAQISVASAASVRAIARLESTPRKSLHRSSCELTLANPLELYQVATQSNTNMS